MFVTTKRPGDVLVLTMGNVQARVYFLRSRRRRGGTLLRIKAPPEVIIRQERFPLLEEQVAS